MSKLGLANKLFFQWFFIRLTKNIDRQVSNYNLISYDILPYGFAARGNGTEWYSIQYWMLPLTGWKCNYIYLGKKSPRYWQITKKKLINNDNNKPKSKYFKYYEN
jgi:hypothetical protein